MQSKAINIKISPQETPLGQISGRTLQESITKCTFFVTYSCTPPWASLSCQCSKIVWADFPQWCLHLYLKNWL